MKLKITGEQQFSVLKNTFAIGPSESGYTLAYSATGNPSEFTMWDKSTEAGENVVVNGAAEEMYFKLVGNTGEVIIKY